MNMEWKSFTHDKKNASVLARKIWVNNGIAVQFLREYKACFGEPVRNAVGGRLQRPCCLSRVDHNWKIRNRRQRTDIGKYSFVNSNIRPWNKLPMKVLGNFPSKLSTFRERVRKVVNEVK